MTAETDLLPLPEEECMGGNDVYGVEYPLYTSDHMQAYARANLAELQREVEGLRAEVERLKELVRSVGYETLTRAEAAEARAERLAEALRLISKQGTHYGPDGTRESWQHWAEIARATLEQETTNG